MSNVKLRLICFCNNLLFKKEVGQASVHGKIINVRFLVVFEIVLCSEFIALTWIRENLMKLILIWIVWSNWASNLAEIFRGEGISRIRTFLWICYVQIRTNNYCRPVEYKIEISYLVRTTQKSSSTNQFVWIISDYWEL